MNLVLLNMKWSLPYPTRPKQDSEIYEAKIESEYSFGSWSKTNIHVMLSKEENFCLDESLR